MYKKQPAKGFTVIEVLVAIGVAAVILGIVLMAMSIQRARGVDARTKEVLSNMRAAATETHATLGSFAPICSDATTAAKNAINNLRDSLGLTDTQYTCIADVDHFVILFPLKAKSGYWCVDALGNSKELQTLDYVTIEKSCTEVPDGSGGGQPPPPALNSPPTVDAGPDVVVTYPASSGTLSATASDSDGFINSYTWEQVSGESATINSPSSASTLVTGLDIDPGTYQFKITVTDDDGATASDIVRVTVSEPDNPAQRTLTPCRRTTTPADCNKPTMTLTSYLNETLGFYESLPRGYYNVSNQTKKWPTIIFLHGIGERGDGTAGACGASGASSRRLACVLKYGIPKEINAGAQLEYNNERFIVIAPQLQAASTNWHPFRVGDIIDYAVANYNVDPNRIYLAGLSLGGFGTVYYPALSSSNANRIAAIAASDGAWGNTGNTLTLYHWSGSVTLDICRLSNAGIPMWLFHGDGTSAQHPPWNTTSARDEAEACTPSGITPNPLVSGYATGTAWDRAFSTGHSYENPNVYEWLLDQSL